MIRILVTGFGAFPGAPVNPTQTLVRRLSSHHARTLQRLSIDVRPAVLPVVYDEVELAITDLLAKERPQIVLHLGLAARRKTISVEARAKNRLSIVHPDSSRQRAGVMHVTPGVTPERAARWPVERLCKAITQAGFRATRSIDAGDYLCNQALYLSLGKHDGLCGFLHVPRLRKKWRLENPDEYGIEFPPRRPSMAELERSVIAAIRVMAVEHRRQHSGKSSA